MNEKLFEPNETVFDTNTLLFDTNKKYFVVDIIKLAINWMKIDLRVNINFHL